ncbi:MAG: MauE/DoxX family redox-associated membrane protein [Thermodesulfobacteriota bacterium]
MMFWTTIEVLARWMLGGIFLYSSFHKIADPSQFVRIIVGYDLFPPVTIYPLAVICPFFELLCGAALILGVYPRGAVLIVNVMLFLFIVAISINLARGHQFDCGCFSFTHDPDSSALQLLYRDVFYLAAGLYVLFFRLPRKSFLHINIGSDKKTSP